MPGSPQKKARHARTTKLLGNPRTIDRLCAGICDAHTLGEFCTFHDVPYTVMNLWIQSDDVRRQRYADALAVRDTHQKDLVIRELMALLQVDPIEAFQANGRMKQLNRIPADVRRAIAGLEIKENFVFSRKTSEIRKLKFWSKPHAIELLMKHLKMGITTEVTGPGGAPVPITVAWSSTPEWAKPKA